MAFLCPSRVGRDTKERKKKVKASAALGRITGSDSVDTLVRVGLEKQHGLPADCKLFVIKNFESLSNDELPVKRGQEVYLLYAENEWYYVINAQGQEGFVPRTFCTTVKRKSKPTKEKERYRQSSGGSSESNLINDSFESSGTFFSDNSENVSRFDSGILLSDKNSTGYETSDMYPEVRPFRKTSHGQYIALYDFTGLDENDVTVERAELFDVLNIEDPDWSWIRKYDGQEGFVPKSYICPVEPLRIQERISTLENSAAQIQFHAVPSIRQPLVSNQQLRFQHSTPQPSNKFPLRPSSLAVSKCFSSETNVSDLKKERSALRVHDCSHKERLERNAKARSRSNSPAASDHHASIKSNPGLHRPSRSSSPATSDRSRLRVSSTSLNEDPSHSRSSTPSIKSMTRGQGDRLTPFTLIPFNSISPIQSKGYDQNFTPQRDTDLMNQFCPSSSSSRRPSVSKTSLKDFEAVGHYPVSERNANAEQNMDESECIGLRDGVQDHYESKEFNNAISASIVHTKPPPYAYAVGRCRKTIQDKSTAETNYVAHEWEHKNPMTTEKSDHTDGFRTMDSAVITTTRTRKEEVDISTDHIQKFQAIRNQIENKLNAHMTNSNVSELSGRKAFSQPTSRAVSPTVLKEDKQSQGDADKTMKKAIHSNLTREEYRQMSNTQSNQGRRQNVKDQSEMNPMSPRAVTKASSVSNLVSKFNATLIPKPAEKRTVTFKSSVSSADNQTGLATSNSIPPTTISFSKTTHGDQSESDTQLYDTRFSSMSTKDYKKVNMDVTFSKDCLSSDNPSSVKLNGNISDRRQSLPKTFIENSLPRANGIQGISELVMLYDYSSADSNGLVVGRGENVYVDNPDQTDPYWVWVFHPKSQGYGYVPRDYVKSTMLKTTL